MEGETPLIAWDRLVIGQLDNGIRYYVMANKTPPNRVYANAVVNVGSVNELDHQQGVAHFLEHLVFQGTEQFPSAQMLRDLLASWGMSFGGDANASTDFRQTIYTLEAPTSSKQTLSDSSSGSAGLETAMGEQEAESETESEEDDSDISLDQSTESVVMAVAEGEGSEDPEQSALFRVLNVLHQLVFRATIDQDAVDLERGAVLGELTEDNSVDYRTSIAYFQFLHRNNILSSRFPIGLRSCIEASQAPDLLEFYKTHYRPNNTVVFVVGDIDPEQCVSTIEKVFGGESVEPLAPQAPPIDHQFELIPSVSHPERTNFYASDEGVPLATVIDLNEHNYSEFHHELITTVDTEFVLLRPLSQPRTQLSNIRSSIINAVIEQSFDDRIYSLKSDFSYPPFVTVSWSQDDAVSENCSKRSFTLSCRRDQWKDGLLAATKEIHRMFKFGIEEGELEYCKQLVLKELQEDAAQENTTNSSSFIEELMTSFNRKSVLVSPSQMLSYGRQLMGTITIDDVNERIRDVFSHLENLCHGLQSPAHFKVFVSTSPAVSDLSRDAVADILRRSVQHIERRHCPTVPAFLTDMGEAKDLRKKLDPFFTPVDMLRTTVLPGEWVPENKPVHPFVVKEDNRVYDPNTDTWITQLNNGMTFSYKNTTLEKKKCLMRLEMTGGKMAEYLEKSDCGCTEVTMNALLHNHLSRFSESQIDRFCNLYCVSLSTEVMLDKTIISLEFNTIDDGLRRAIELLQLVILQPLHDLKTYHPDFSGPHNFDEPFQGIESKAFARSKHEKALDWKMQQNQMEEASHNQLMHFAFPEADEERAALSRRLWEITEEACNAFTVEKSLEVLKRTWKVNNMRLIVVGDFGSGEKLEDLILTYFGVIDCPLPSLDQKARTVTPTSIDTTTSWLAIPSPKTGQILPFKDLPFGPVEKGVPLESSFWLLDDEKRAYVEIVMPSVNQWGDFGSLTLDPSVIVQSTQDPQTLARRSHPMFVTRTLRLLITIINNRLYTEVREQKGLLYSVAIECGDPPLLTNGFAFLTFAPLPDKIDETLKAVLQVLHDVCVERRITDSDFSSAKTPKEADLRRKLHTNHFWLYFLQLDSYYRLQPIQQHSVVEFYEELTLDDLLFSLQTFRLIDTERMWICKGSSGPTQQSS